MHLVNAVPPIVVTTIDENSLASLALAIKAESAV
jgi:hypothetical protein